MSDGETPAEPSRPKRWRKRVLLTRGLGLLLGMALSAAMVLMVLLVLAVMGRSVPLPDWVVAEVEGQLNEQLSEGRQISIEGIAFGLRDASYRPTFDLETVVLRDIKGTALVSLPQLRAQFDTSELLLGRVAVETMDLSGATLRLERSADGEVSLGLDSPGGAVQTTRTLDTVLEWIDTIFDSASLREFEDLRADGLVLDINDLRAGRRFLVEDGTLRISNTANELSATATFNFALNEDAPSLLHFSAQKQRGRDGARLVAKFNDLSTQALSGQVSALSWLGVLDAPVTGALTAEIGAAGHISELAGTLNISQGLVVPNEASIPLRLDGAQTYIRYAAETGRLIFDDITIDAPELRLKATGHADLIDLEAGLPKTILGQLRFTDIRLDPATMFETAVEFDSGVLDLRYRPDELRVDIGQLQLKKEDADINARGHVAAGDEGWELAIDAQVDAIDAATVMRLWPVGAVPATRDWLTANLLGGALSDGAAALRLPQGGALQAAVTFDFEAVEVRYLKTLPTIEQATGYFSILEDAMHIAVHDGIIRAPDGTDMQAAGSVMTIPNLRAKPVEAAFDIKLTGPISGALHLLDEKPFEFLSKSDLGPDMADGTTAVDLRLEFPFAKTLKLDQIRYDVAARLFDLRSDQLVPGRSLSADLMRLSAGDGQLVIAGPGSIDDIPIDVTWSRAIGPDTGARSKVEAQIALSPATLSRFGVILPDGSVNGAGTADVEIDLLRGAPPKMRLSSDLSGIGLRIDALDYRKSQNSSGDLRLEMQLGDQPKVESLTISANGLQADGSVELTGDGQLARAVFAPLNVAGKLNSRVEIIGRGAGNPVRIAVRGGQIDIRNFGFGAGGQTSGPPLDLVLDRVVITDNIALDDFKGVFRNDRGLEGQFKALINGAAEVQGTIVPTPRGVAVRIQSTDAGAVLRGSGVVRNVRRGQMVLTLRPNGRPGQFIGRLAINDIRVKNAPALADLLSAISVIGLLEQLSGNGILFQNVQADFVLTPGGVRLASSSAVGPSMGISMQGIYNTASDQMDMQGVVSPIYAVNGLFGRLFAPREGEGLFGFNYTLTGSASEPRVGVNPLSVFTPGIFREIFRQPVPQLPN